MRIVLINPKFLNIWEPLGLGYIASYCKKGHYNNPDIEFYDENFDDLDKIIIAGANADYVGISSTTPTYRRALEIAKQIKGLNNNTRIILGGWHPTTSPRTVLQSDIMFNNSKNELIDYVVVGEGERAFLDIVTGIASDNFILGTRLEFKNLPWPDRKLIRQDRLLDLCQKMCGERIASFQSRRGCPMRCSFCGEHCMSGSLNSMKNSVRVRDARDVLDEIEYVNKDFGIDSFQFLDPTWVAPVSAAIDFCEEKIRRNNKIPWSGMAHASFTNRSLLELMKRANCSKVSIGVESGSQKILNKIGKGTTIQRIKNVFNWCKELEISNRAFCIIGMPEETRNDIELTKQLIREIRPDVLGVTILCPYPGSLYYNHKTMKYYDYSNADEYTNDFWFTSNFTNQELKNIQMEFYREFKDIMCWHQHIVCGGKE